MPPFTLEYAKSKLLLLETVWLLWKRADRNIARDAARRMRGMRVIKINRKQYRADSIVVCMMTGTWPICSRFHKNGDNLGDRFDNLTWIPYGGLLTRPKLYKRNT